VFFGVFRLGLARNERWRWVTTLDPVPAAGSGVKNRLVLSAAGSGRK
jgi:hypothetical protein